MLLLTLRGTPTCYYGDELGMQNGAVAPELMRDPQGKDNPEHSRDPQRIPMQWDNSPNADFSAPEVMPRLPVADDYQTYNVEAEQQHQHGMGMLIHTLLHLRRSLPALNMGSYQTVEQENENCLVYLRQYNEQRYLVLLNFSAQVEVVNLSTMRHGRIALSTHIDREGALDLSSIHLRGNEGLLIDVSEAIVKRISLSA